MNEDVDRRKTREINLLTKENRDNAAQLKRLRILLDEWQTEVVETHHKYTVALGDRERAVDEIIRLRGLLTEVMPVMIELQEATAKFGRFASPHEGYAILLEELDELWAEIKSKDGFASGRLKKEAIQVAAMALRFLRDVCGKDT